MTTHIIKVPLKNLLSQKNTKAELTAFLAKTAKQRADAIGGKIVMAWGTECNVTHKYMVWNKDDVPNPVLPSLSEYGWAMKDKEWVPVTTVGASACQVQVRKAAILYQLMLML